MHQKSVWRPGFARTRWGSLSAFLDPQTPYRIRGLGPPGREGNGGNGKGGEGREWRGKGRGRERKEEFIPLDMFTSRWRHCYHASNTVTLIVCTSTEKAVWWLCVGNLSSQLKTNCIFGNYDFFYVCPILYKFYVGYSHTSNRYSSDSAKTHHSDHKKHIILKRLPFPSVSWFLV